MSVLGNRSRSSYTEKRQKGEREEIMPKVKRTKEMMIRVEINERENRKNHLEKSVKQKPDYLRGQQN